MRKILLIVLLFPTMSFANDCSLSYMLEWKYGPVAGTHNNDTITFWNHTSISKPDATQIASDLIECKKEDARTEKKEAVRNEGLSRIQAELPGIDNFDTLQLMREFILSVAPASRQLTTSVQLSSDIYTAGTDAMVVLNNYTGYNEINNYDPENDPSWP